MDENSLVQLMQQLQQQGGGAPQQANPFQSPPQETTNDPEAAGLPNFSPDKSDIIGNLLAGEKIQTMKELRDKYIGQYQPKTKKGKANEYLKAILAGFTHNAYITPVQRAEMMAQKDYQLETGRHQAQAKDQQNAIQLWHKEQQAKQAEDKLAETIRANQAKEQASQAKLNISKGWLELGQAKTPKQIEEIQSRMDLNTAKAFDLLNPKNAHASVYVMAQDQLNKEFEGKDLSDPKIREAYNNRRTAIESDMHKGIELMKNMPKESTSSGTSEQLIDTAAGIKRFPVNRSNTRNLGASEALQNVARQSGLIPSSQVPNIMGQVPPQAPQGQPSPFQQQGQPQQAPSPTAEIVKPIAQKGKPQPPPLAPNAITDLPLMEADIPGVMKNSANQKTYDSNMEISTSMNTAAGTLIKDYEKLKDYTGAIRGADLVQRVMRATGNTNVDEQTVLQSLENARGSLLLKRSGTAVSDQENQRMKRYTASLQSSPDQVIADTLLFKFSQDLLNVQKNIDWKRAGVRNPEQVIQQTNMADFLIGKVDEILKLTKAGKKQEANEVLKDFSVKARKELAKQIADSNKRTSGAPSSTPKTRLERLQKLADSL